MLYCAAMFLFVGMMAGALNWAGVAAVATQSSWTSAVKRGRFIGHPFNGATHRASVVTGQFRHGHSNVRGRS